MVTIGSFPAIGDALRRRRPDAVKAIGEASPALRDALADRRPLGEAVPTDASAALAELAAVSSTEARKDLDEVLQRLARRSRTLARLRFGSGAVSTITSAGLIALLFGTNHWAQVTAAVVSFLSSMLTLVSSYLEDYSGGDGSTRRLRESMSAQVKALAEADGRMKIARARSSQDELLGVLQALNGVLAEIQLARAQLGMAI